MSALFHRFVFDVFPLQDNNVLGRVAIVLILVENKANVNAVGKVSWNAPSL
jgi:hypothetical protein